MTAKSPAQIITGVAELLAAWHPQTWRHLLAHHTADSARFVAPTRVVLASVLSSALAARGPRAGRTGGAALPTAAGPADHPRAAAEAVESTWTTAYRTPGAHLGAARVGG